MKSQSLLGALAITLLAAGCADAGPPETEQPAATEAASDVGLQIEQAERAIDRGQDARAAASRLRAALDHPAITPAERRTAVLALSRAYEAAGDDEQAIAVVEAEIAAHADDLAWEGEAFKRRLRLLLTGSEKSTGIDRERDEPVAPFAHVVTKSFPPNADGAVKATFFIVGGNAALSEELGTFNIRGALDEQQEKACPLCERRVNVSQHRSQSDWLLIPGQQAHFDDALLVFYFDLGKNRIPARYERHLPMKVDDIVAELEQNKSFVIAKERPGAPPAVLLAAPRTALLDEVERYLSGLDSLPTEIQYAPISNGLRPEEIRSVVRGHWFKEVRQCYDSLLKRDADAGGKVVLSFRISGEDGSVSELELDPEADALSEDQFVECMLSSAKNMSFPATGSGSTTVRYPVEMTP